MKRISEVFDLARDEYIAGYDDKQIRIFPTLALVAKEFEISFSTLRKKVANEGWFKKRKSFQQSREEFVIRKNFKGKYSKLAKVSRNTLVLVEYIQTAINKEVEDAKAGKISHSIEDMVRLVSCLQKIQKLSEQANTTLNNLEDPLLSFTE